LGWWREDGARRVGVVGAGVRVGVGARANGARSTLRPAETSRRWSRCAGLVADGPAPTITTADACRKEAWWGGAGREEEGKERDDQKELWAVESRARGGQFVRQTDR
jgi:hypothetical protein